MLRRPARVDPGCLALLLLAYVAVALLLERHGGRTGEGLLGGATWLALIVAVRRLTAAIRARVAAVVLVASAGEVLGSLILGSTPTGAAASPGHGLVYLAGRHLAHGALLGRRPHPDDPDGDRRGDRVGGARAAAPRAPRHRRRARHVCAARVPDPRP
jgi:hypothetical protein